MFDSNPEGSLRRLVGKAGFSIQAVEAKSQGCPQWVQVRVMGRSKGRIMCIQDVPWNGSVIASVALLSSSLVIP
jgi:hypothetical protein